MIDLYYARLSCVIEGRLHQDGAKSDMRHLVYESKNLANATYISAKTF